MKFCSLLLCKVLLVLVLATLFSCKKTEDPAPTPISNNSLPTTYSFIGSEVNYRQASLTLSMMKELIALAETGNQGNNIQESKLKNMYENNGNPFSDTSLNNKTGFSIKSSTSLSFQSKMDNYIKSLAQVSGTLQSGSKGIAGILTYLGTPPNQKLADTNGHVFNESLEKGLMGAFQYYQVTAVYLSAPYIRASVSKTEKLRNWDLAFGYMGVAPTFPTSNPNAAFWGEYFPTVDAALDFNQKKIMNAFIQGRIAIDNNDQAIVEQAAATIKTEFEKTAASMGLRYLKKSRTAIANNDLGRKCNGLTECLGFIKTLQYNPDKKISDAEYNEIIALIGGNFYDTSDANLLSCITKISSIYGLDPSKF